MIDQLKHEKNNSLTVEREALESLENFYAAMSISERRFDPNHLLKQVQDMSSAISVHRNCSEKYILHLEEKLRLLSAYS
jgi:hypothetical protein